MEATAAMPPPIVGDALPSPKDGSPSVYDGLCVEATGMSLRL